MKRSRAVLGIAALAAVLVALLLLVMQHGDGGGPLPRPPKASSGPETGVDFVTGAPERRRVGSAATRSQPADDVAQASPAEEQPAPTCELTVTVVDASGRRMPGMAVAVTRRADRSQPSLGGYLFPPPEPTDVGRRTTDSSGVATVAAPGAGALDVRAASDAWHGTASVVLPEGTTKLAVEVRVAPAFRLVGRVTLDDGSPIADARVYIAVPLPGLMARRPRHLEVVSTDDEGRFRTGAHDVPETRIVECYVMAGSIAGHSHRFDVGQGLVDDLELVVPRGTKIRGRCVDEQGEPLAGVRVRGILPSTGEITFTGGDGRFTMPVPGSGGGLVFFLEGRVQTGLRALTGPPEGKDIGDVVIPMGGTLAGTIVEESGAPVAGAEVVIVEPISLHAADRVTTDTQGRFRSDLIGPGVHLLMVRRAATGAPSGGLQSLTRIDGFTAGTFDAVVELPRSGWTDVTVVDADGNPRPFEQGVVTLARDDTLHGVPLHHVFETVGATRDSFAIEVPGRGTYELELLLPTTGEVDLRRFVVTDTPPESVTLTPR